jgi:hypothetical protein
MHAILISVQSAVSFVVALAPALEACLISKGWICLKPPCLFFSQFLMKMTGKSSIVAGKHFLPIRLATIALF